MVQALALFVAGRPQEYGSRTVEAMFDSSDSYWCSPPGAALPQVVTFRLYAPARLEQILIDPRVPGYEPCGPREVLVEAVLASGDGAFVRIGQATLAPGVVGAVGLEPVECVGVRVCFLSTHGGPCVVVTELRVMGTPRAAGSPAPVQLAAPHASSVVAPSLSASPRNDARGGAPRPAPGGAAPVPPAPPPTRARGAALSPGQRVMARFVDGAPRPAKVLQFDGERYEVAWDADLPPSWVIASDVRPA